jgi:hypothetical protein
MQNCRPHPLYAGRKGIERRITGNRRYQSQRSGRRAMIVIRTWDRPEWAIPKCLPELLCAVGLPYDYR